MAADNKPAAEIIEFIHANKGSWLPRDVYALIDKGVSSAYVQVVAAHAVVFYDGVTPKSLATIAAEARAGIPAATVMANDLVVMFEWFADVKAESDALRKQVPPLEPQRSGETPAQFDVRKRLYDEDLVRAVTPADGKIDLTTFSSDLAATFSADAKGCAVGAVSVDLTAVPYFTFRTAMGNTTAKNPIVAKKSRSIAGGEFANGEARSMKLTSKPVCGPAAASLLASGGRAKVQLSRSSKGGDWSATGEFVDKTGEIVPAAR